MWDQKGGIWDHIPGIRDHKPWDQAQAVPFLWDERQKVLCFWNLGMKVGSVMKKKKYLVIPCKQHGCLYH